MDGLCWADAAETNDYEWDRLQEDDALLQERIKKQEEETQRPGILDFLQSLACL